MLWQAGSFLPAETQLQFLKSSMFPSSSTSTAAARLLSLLLKLTIQMNKSRNISRLMGHIHPVVRVTAIQAHLADVTVMSQTML